jgi:uncharacterized protein YbjT (DUF2867 family)
MQAINSNGPILVLGGTGKTGRRVAERLTARGVEVRLGSRDAAPRFDWNDRATWPAALAGVHAAYISYFPDLAVPGAPEATGAFAREAARAGVQRLVLLSGRGEEEAQRAEGTVREAGVDLTVLRCSWFAQNFTEGALAEDVLGGDVALPVPDIGEPFVDVDDIADAAVVALLEDGHAGELYELTGPRLLTFEEAIAEIAAASGRDIRFRRVPMAEYTARLAGYGVPEEEIALLAYLFGEVLDGRNATVTDGVSRVLGRDARDFADHVRGWAS